MNPNGIRFLLSACILSIACARTPPADAVPAAGGAVTDEDDASDVGDLPAVVLTSYDAPSSVAITRARLVGEIEILGPGESTFVRLCENGQYVRFGVCGGYVRGRWQLNPEGIVFSPEQACLTKGVRGTERGATDACVFFRRNEFVGCLPAEEGMALAEREGIDGLSLDHAWGDPVLQPIFAPVHESEIEGLRLRHTAEPRVCNPRYQPRTVSELFPGKLRAPRN